MHISDPTGPEPGSEPCRFPKLEECAHFHYERVQLPRMSVTIQTNMDHSLHSQHSHDDGEWHMVQVTSGEECWLLQRNLENFRMLDSQLHQCIYDRKISQLQDLSSSQLKETEEEAVLVKYLERFSEIANNSINCGPVLNWLQMDNKGHRLLVPSEESRSINTPAVAAAYSVRRYVSQARDELNLEVGDMISVIDMASPGESIWWRGKRGFQVGFFPQHCVHIIGDKVPRNMPLPPPVVGSLALMSPIKPVLRKHGKLIAFFRSFILNRPSRRRLKQTGILKERVFGCDLGEHLSNSGHDVPMVLKCCTEFIETHGIVDGIYRLSGVTSNIQKLRNAFDEDRIPNLYNEDILQDIHSVASLLKMYFRELPNPLCTYQLYQSFVNAVQGCNSSVRNSETDHERLLKMREAVQKLPPPHYRTLEYLMRHLARVAKHSRNTGMTTRNLAIVWAPNLLRCAELEVGGVAALQGVGVQAVVTEFLICYTDLIFCDNLPNLDRPMEDFISSPRRSRPKSLAISTPTKLITLEEARTKHLLNKECGYIEVGGGPNSLPKKYHTIIELPPGTRKRGLSKRSPMGWRSFFSKSRSTAQVIASKPRKASTPGIIVSEKAITETDLADMKRVLRSVKSAESLTSGHSEPNSSDIDILGPLHSLSKPSGHNRSISHDSYFDNLQDSHNNSEGSLLDLSEIQLNFELEESEMRIFSEDESLVSSPRVQRDGHRKVPTRNRFDEYLGVTQSNNPSPKKQPRVVLSPESASRKRTRLEDQLSDIQFIDCNTPENSTSCILSTTAVVHKVKEEQVPLESYQPKNKSPRNSEIIELGTDIYKRQSLNLESTSNKTPTISKSQTDVELSTRYPHYTSTTPTPQSPAYRPFVDSSTATTPDDCSPSLEIIYQKLKKSPGELPLKFKPPELSSPAPKSPTYENVLTTISIIYKSPTKTFTAKKIEAEYEDVDIKTENAQVPTSTANLPIQQAQCIECVEEKRPKSFNDLESLRKVIPPVTETDIDALFASLKTTVDKGSVTDLSLSEVLNSSSECLNSNRTSFSLPLTPTRGTMSPNVSLTEMNESVDTLSQDLLTPLSFNDTSKNVSLNASKESLDKRSSEILLNESDEQNLITPSEEDNLSASLKNFNPEINSNESNETGTFPEYDNTLSELYDNTYDNNVKENSDKKEEIEGLPYENIEFANDVVNLREKPEDVTIARPKSINLIEFSPLNEEVNLRSPSNEKRKQTETVDDVVYQQVKYFRRSVHELNSLIDEEKSAESLEEPAQNNVHDELTDIALDSLEAETPHVYENVEQVYENVTFSSDSLETNKSEPARESPVERKVSVKSLTNKFEVAEKTPNVNQERKKVRETLPPCLRARNLKNSIKTRSLDEDEFRREFESYKLTRRKSFDENLAVIKLNTLPKSLNKPKKLPGDGELQVHLNHSIENIQQSNPNLNRERIEKYKEERRKYLHDKYRSESFKEDKDVLLSRLKVFKPKEEELDAIKKTIVKKKIDEMMSDAVVKEEASPKRVDIKSKTAIFEAKAVEDVELRPRRRDFSEKQRNTFDVREREPGDLAEGNKRNTIDIKPIRKDKSSTPTYCIKDMKAIFESKSHQ